MLREAERNGNAFAAIWHLDRRIAARPDDETLHEERSAVYGKLGREADRQAELARVFELGANQGLVIPHAEELGRAGLWAEAAGLLARCGRGQLSGQLSGQALILNMIRGMGSRLFFPVAPVAAELVRGQIMLAEFFA